MVNLDSVKTGDTLVVEVPVYVYASGSIEFEYTDVRYGYDEPFGNIKVLEHKPKPIKEPTGLGAVVKVKGRATGLERYIVRVSATDSLWAFTLYPGEPHNWSSIVATHDMVEVVSTGVDTNGG